MGKTTGGFTLPGESGYEELTLSLAKKWGADVIRDSDGTVLSDELINAGYGIYSTICVIRDHNDWAKKNLDKLQQTFLMTEPCTAVEDRLTVSLMDGFFSEQFRINDSENSQKYWQVFDRTTGLEVKDWTYQDGKVTFKTIPWHRYSVNFLAFRIWEEISMYNHVTNNWNKEHLMQIDPIYPETQEYLCSWLDNWCQTHPATTVVRFTSMFYNFVWIWGANPRRQNLFTDWASYDFTVSPRMLDLFKEKYGYALTSEDFINKGALHATHMPADKKKRDYMAFVNDFVVDFGKKLVDIVHQYGKKAYVFYDDSWVGVEPWGERFKDFGFDGLIKCVFSGFECRLCAGVDAVETHEIRLHPYLFPVGLGGAPTFCEGGNPTQDAKGYWKNVRRALLREPVDRIGLGGYLSLTLPFPDFNDYIEKIADEFRMIRDIHKNGKPFTKKAKIAVLTYWGKLRSWTCSGHKHEHPELDLINIIESLSGLPFDVKFISFDDILAGKADDFDVIINAGKAGSAWSGGDVWKNEKVIEALTKWTYDGGVFIGVNEPSAACGADRFFRMSHVLGVDKDLGDYICHGRFTYDIAQNDLICQGSDIGINPDVFITSADTVVLADKDNIPVLTSCTFGNGKGIYIGGYSHSSENARTLLNIILDATIDDNLYITDNPQTECAYYPDGKILFTINNSDKVQHTRIQTESGIKDYTIEAYDSVTEKL